MILQRWTILDEGGGQLVDFTSFIDIDIYNEGQALSYPVEEGGFMSYNKIQTPLSIRLTLGKQGMPFDFSKMSDTLDKFQAEATKVMVASPGYYFPSMTLQSWAHRHEQRRGAGMLIADLDLVEVREVTSQTTNVEVSSPRNPTSSGNKNVGKQQPQSGTSGTGAQTQRNQSILKQIWS